MAQDIMVHRKRILIRIEECSAQRAGGTVRKQGITSYSPSRCSRIDMVSF